MLPVYPQVRKNHTFLRPLVLGDSGRAYTPIPSLLSPSTVTHAFSLSSSPLRLPLHSPILSLLSPFNVTPSTVTNTFFLSPLPFHYLPCLPFSPPLPFSPIFSLLSPSTITHAFPLSSPPPLSPMPSFSSSPSLSPPSNHLLPTALHCQPSYR